MLTPLDNPLILKKLNYHLRLRRLVPHIREHLSETLQLSDGARVACMEKTAFAKFFSRVVGVTFHEFVQQCRVALAIEQMLSSDSSLTEIAFATGFQAMNTFERAFKKVTGATPSAYRKRLLVYHEIRSQELVNHAQQTAISNQQTGSGSVDG